MDEIESWVLKKKEPNYRPALLTHLAFGYYSNDVESGIRGLDCVGKLFLVVSLIRS